MLRIARMFGSSLAVLVFAATVAPSAYASPLGRLLHLRPHLAQTQDARISVQIYNKGELFQDLKVDGHVYTLLPRRTITITAPAGTQVYADSTGFGHRKGDLLFEIMPQMKHATVSLN